MRKSVPDEDREQEHEPSARPFWSGTITFGLVSIPVNLYPANRESRVSLRMLGSGGEPLSREYYAPDTAEDLESMETIRGYEVRKGKYVTITDEELERLAPEKSRDIDLRVFVKRDEIPQLYFKRAYFLTPADKSAKAYRLLAETMDRTRRAGIATFVMRGKEYLVAIFSDRGILRANTLRFSDEIRTPRGVGLPEKREEPPKRIVRQFETAIARLTRKTLDPKELRDEYSEALLKLAEKKHARHKDVVETHAKGRPEKVVDLMEVLKRSLGQNGKKTKRAA
ncbi:MAG TPA: Ku protein [Terriglobia bacterium]|nr:Ku protein [Terriglobia bacterium]